MVSLDAPWIAPHDDYYRRILELVRAKPPTGLEAFLDNEVYELIGEILDSRVLIDARTYRGAEAHTQEGDPVMYWDGQQLIFAPYNKRDRRLGAFFYLAERISRYASDLPREPVILDLGAGTCIQSIILRAIGFRGPILNLDVFQSALDIGKALCSALGLTDINFAGADLSAADLGHLEPIKDFAGGRPIFVVSRYAIYPFYSAAEYGRLFDYLIRHLGIVGGVHLERTGRFTPSFEKVKAQAKFPITIPAKHVGKNDDPLAHLIGRPDVRVLEHDEISPHYVDEYFPRYLAWRSALAK